MYQLSCLIFCLFLWASVFSQPMVRPAFPQLASFDKVRDFTLSADETEAYLTLQSPLEEISIIARIVNRDEQWQEPEMASFSGAYKDLEPFLSPDNLSLYFASNRPIHPDSTAPADFNIWLTQRANADAPWGLPSPLDSTINSAHNEFYPAVSQTGNLYWTSDRPGGKGLDDIYYSAWQEDHYTPAQSLGEGVNTKGYEFNAYVAPDESFLLFSGYNRADGLGSGDLYISLRDKQGQWLPAQNLGPDINSPFMDYCPFYAPASQQLYFTSRRSALPLTPAISSLSAFKARINQYQNGFSRIYQVDFNKPSN